MISRKTNWLFLWLLTASLWSSPLRAQDEPHSLRIGRALQTRLDTILSDLEELHSTPIGLISMLGLEELSPWIPLPLLIPELEALSRDTTTDQLVRMSVVHMLARARLALGEVDASETALADEGFLTRWSIVGPFPNEAMVGFETAYGPELRRYQDDTFDGRIGEISWRDVTGLTRLGYLNLAQLAQPAFSAVAYAVTRVDLPGRSNGRLWTSTDGAYSIWLNGELIAKMSTNLGDGIVREWWDIALDRGANELVVKMAGDSSSLGFTLRLTDREGYPLPGMQSSAELTESDETLVSSDPPNAMGCLLTIFDSLLLQDNQPHEFDLDVALAGAAAVLRRSHADDPLEPWRDFLDHGDVCDGENVAALLHCSAAQDHYWERHSSLARAIDAVESNDPTAEWIKYLFARLVFEGVGDSSLEDTTEMCNGILTSDPAFIPARLLLARVYESEDQHWRARNQIESALLEAPDSPEVVHQAILSRQVIGETPELLDLYLRQVELAADRSSVHLALAPALLRAGLTAEALTALETGLRIAPNSMALMKMRADFLLNQGDLPGAEAALLSVTERFSGNALAWEDLGRFYVRTEQPDSAELAFDVALNIEPQNQELSLYRARLRATETPFYLPFQLDLEQIRSYTLPDEMVRDRDYYYLVDQQVIQVHGNGLGTRYIQTAFQVQTRQGANQLRSHSIQFTPGAEVVELLSVRIIKADGTVQESFDQWENSLSQPWYGLYYDYRALVLGFDDLAPGDILELQYTIADVSSENMFDSYFGDLWFVQDIQPKGFARYGILHPAEMNLNFRPPSLPHEALTTTEDDSRLELYQLTRIPHVERESSMPGFSSVADYIHVSTFDSWEQVTSWYWNLVKDQLVVSPEIESVVSELIDGLTTTEERVAAIHEYVVRNTRYVGLEFGIHGFRPYRTTVIFSRRFGDCKDTASLMYVMLDLAGIESHIALVRTRDLGAIEQMPASLAVFNHAITYVTELDMFLDGTAGHSGLRELPSGDQGATSVIVLDGEGYRFLTIPMSTPEENRIEYSFEVDLTSEGAPTRGTILANGQFAPRLRRQYESEEHILESFQQEMRSDYPGAVIHDVSFQALDDITSPVEVTFELSGMDWTRQSGQRITMLPLGLEAELTSRFAGSATRRQPLDLGFPFISNHHMTYTLPDDLVVAIPEPSISSVTPFGSFELLFELEGTTLTVDGRFEIAEALISVEDYAEYRDFIIAAETAISRNLELTRTSND